MESHATKPSSINASGRPPSKTAPVTNEAPASSSSAKLIPNHTSTSPPIKNTATSIIASSTVTASRTASPSPSTTPPPTHVTGEHSSPPKRSTDHSINSIISSPVLLNHSASSVISDDSPETDPLAFAQDTDIVNTEAREKSSTTASRSIGDPLKVRATSDKVVKAPAIIFPSSGNSETVKKSVKFSPKNIETDDEEVHIIDDFSSSSSSSSDGVEFVSESAVPRKPREIAPPNKQKYLISKHSSSNTRSNSPKSARSLTTKLTKSDDSKRQSVHSAENKEHDLDVSQIMKALKELKVIFDFNRWYFW